MEPNIVTGKCELHGVYEMTVPWAGANAKFCPKCYQREDVPYSIARGFAAELRGAERKLADAQGLIRLLGWIITVFVVLMLAFMAYEVEARGVSESSSGGDHSSPEKVNGSRVGVLSSSSGGLRAGVFRGEGGEEEERLAKRKHPPVADKGEEASGSLLERPFGRLHTRGQDWTSDLKETLAWGPEVSRSVYRDDLTLTMVCKNPECYSVSMPLGKGVEATTTGAKIAFGSVAVSCVDEGGKTIPCEAPTLGRDDGVEKLGLLESIPVVVCIVEAPMDASRGELARGVRFCTPSSRYYALFALLVLLAGLAAALARWRLRAGKARKARLACPQGPPCDDPSCTCKSAVCLRCGWKGLEQGPWCPACGRSPVARMEAPGTRA